MKSQYPLKRATVTLLLGWTMLFVLLLLLSGSHLRQTTSAIALSEARAHFNKDVAFRQWTARHGGLYVPATEKTPPNPYLSHIASRDISSSDGTKLTLMNPAYAIRQLNEMFTENYGITGHLTSLKLMRPENAPDDWEKAALLRFEEGVKEVTEFTSIAGKPYLRLIQPLITKPGCLKCHAHQDYKVGDIRGGIGVSLPMTLLYSKEQQSLFMLKILLASLWFLGISLILWGKYKLSQAHRERDNAYENMEDLLTERTAHLRESISKAEAASQAKSEFLATMSHEIRTPMNAIIGFVELTMDSELAPKQVNYLSKVQAASNSLLGIINDILDFSKVEAGKLDVESVDFNPASLIDKILALFSGMVSDKRLDLVCDLDSRLPRVLQGDVNRLNQVLVNLVSNAVKFTEKGEVKVLIEELDRDLTMVKVKFSVIDTGIGMEKDVLSKIFSAFTQADSSTTREYGGTGLGLSICKQLVELMGGTIEVESRVGQGSNFSFMLDLPIGNETQFMGSDKSDYIVKPDKIIETKIDSALLTGKQVLLVEDNLINQQVALEKLKKIGLIVDLAADGQEAVKAAVEKKYAAILMDVHMPIMDGYQATIAIRQQEAANGDGCRVPIIAMTANAMVGDREKSLQSGMDEHLSKPIDTNLLQQTLLDLINNKKQ